MFMQPSAPPACLVCPARVQVAFNVLQVLTPRVPLYPLDSGATPYAQSEPSTQEKKCRDAALETLRLFITGDLNVDLGLLMGSPLDQPPPPPAMPMGSTDPITK